MDLKIKKAHWPVLGAWVVAVAALCIGLLQNHFLSNTFAVQTQEYASTTAMLTKRAGDLEIKLTDLTHQSSELVDLLKSEQNRSTVFQSEIGKISETVGVLDKLRTTDPRLLQKYSKVYFLNENYAPTELMLIPGQYSYPSSKQNQLHAKVWPYLERLLLTASSTGANIRVVSAYRSFGTQTQLKASYLITYGTGANKFSADQGYSEHQLGTTVDITALSLKDGYESIDATKEYTWLINNAHIFGFILSYPKGNAYYIYEPWHWRFVGVELATRLFNEKKHLYDLDQAEIDKYLLKIFD